MKLHVVLTSYLMKFMYGDNAFQDPLLLSREIVSTSYQEGLYYISSEANIKKMMKEKKFPHDIYLYAGIPSLLDISLNDFIKPSLVALKLTLTYEDLALLKLEDKELRASIMDTANIKMEKVILNLIYDKEPHYISSLVPNKTFLFNKDEEEKIKDYFLKQIENYHYTCCFKGRELAHSLLTFLQSNSCLKLSDEVLLEIKETYEELIPLLERENV